MEVAAQAAAAQYRILVGAIVLSVAVCCGSGVSAWYLGRYREKKRAEAAATAKEKLLKEEGDPPPSRVVSIGIGMVGDSESDPDVLSFNPGEDGGGGEGEGTHELSLGDAYPHAPTTAASWLSNPLRKQPPVAPKATPPAPPTPDPGAVLVTGDHAAATAPRPAYVSTTWKNLLPFRHSTLPAVEVAAPPLPPPASKKFESRMEEGATLALAPLPPRRDSPSSTLSGIGVVTPPKPKQPAVVVDKPQGRARAVRRVVPPPPPPRPPPPPPPAQELPPPVAPSDTPPPFPRVG